MHMLFERQNEEKKILGGSKPFNAQISSEETIQNNKNASHNACFA